MDVDAYVHAHAHEWERLETLLRTRRLDGAESDELVDRYQQVATHLSVVRTSAADPTLVAHLSSLLARARNRAVGTRVGTWRGVLDFFLERFPAALYRLRWWWLGTLIVVFLVFPVTVETLTRGKSLGKMALGLRTVRDDAGPITFQHAFVRALIAIVEVYAFSGAPAFFTALVNGKGKRLGDFAAGTYVVRERIKLRLPAPPQMPPPLQTWAAGADIAALPPGLALAVRQYLGRLPSIDPDTRDALGRRLAAQVSPYVAPSPPAGTPDEAFLAAVLASRRERDSARLAREADLRRRLTAGP